MDGAGVVLPADSLQQDSCIIDDQSDHLVLTVRLAKETIRNNHPLLMALSDMTSGTARPPWSPASDPPPAEIKRKKPCWQYAVVIPFGLALAAPFSGHSIAGYPPPPPPIEFESVKPAKPTFKVGENIDIVFHYRRDRFCLTTFDRAVQRLPDGAPIFSMRVFGALAEPTNGEFRDYHLITSPPSPLPPGDYLYTGLTHSECAQGGVYDLPHPRAAFSIVK